MNRRCLTHEDIKDLVESQLEVWPLARKNYDGLVKVERKPFTTGDLCGAVQCNPARIISTGAKTDPASISERPCFLCSANRPKEQFAIEVIPGWEVLVNPFPILPIHLTLVASEHKPQDEIPVDIVLFAEALPGMAVFYNGARAGASAPDHLHLQAVLREELPLIRLVEKYHSLSDGEFIDSTSLSVETPFLFFSGIVTPDENGFVTLRKAFSIGGLSQDGTLTDKNLINGFFWIADDGLLRFIIVPRRKHRPSCFYLTGEGQRMISPGAIDMAGLIISPRHGDYTALDNEEILNIYKEVAISSDSININNLFKKTT